jgi:hypothetical protein
MKTRLILMLATAAALFPAQANSDGDMLRKLDVLGTWAFDCSRPSGDDNAVLVYSAPSTDEPPLEHIMMGQLDRVTPIANVVLLKDGKVQWTQQVESGMLTIVNLLESGRLKTWSSKTATGEMLIADGKFAAGDDAPWFNRCDSRR